MDKTNTQYLLDNYRNFGYEEFKRLMRNYNPQLVEVFEHYEEELKTVYCDRSYLNED